MNAKQATETFDRQVAVETTDGEVVFGNNRGMALKGGVSCLAIECADLFRFLPLDALVTVEPV